jgi:hypothetical protein
VSDSLATLKRRLRADIAVLAKAIDDGKLTKAEIQLLKLAVCLLDIDGERTSWRTGAIVMAIVASIAKDYRSALATWKREKP